MFRLNRAVCDSQFDRHAFRKLTNEYCFAHVESLIKKLASQLDRKIGKDMTEFCFYVSVFLETPDP